MGGGGERGEALHPLREVALGKSSGKHRQDAAGSPHYLGDWVLARTHRILTTAHKRMNETAPLCDARTVAHELSPTTAPRLGTFL